MSKIPKYMVVYNDLKNKIQNEVYPIGEKLPSGNELSKDYKVSKLTIKKAIDILVSEGFLRTRSGYGTEVVRKSIDKKVFGPNDGLFNVVGEEHVESTIHTFAVSLPTKDIASKLAMSQDEYVYYIIRSRFLDKKPYSIEETYLPVSVLPDLKIDHLKKSIYSHLKDELFLDFHTNLVRIRGVLANEKDVSILNIPKNSFMVEVEKFANLVDGTPIEYSITKHVYNNFTFEVSFK